MILRDTDHINVVYSMIPPFDERGYLPPGIHPATLAEIEERFGKSTEMRRAQMESLYWLADLARAGGIRRIIINGSFVTKVGEPNDVDCVLLVPRGFGRDGAIGTQLAVGLPFLDIRLVEQEDFDFYSDSFFATDRDRVRKGTVEVML